jgi:hypothetical protein
MGNVCETCVHEPVCEDAAEAKKRNMPIEGCGDWKSTMTKNFAKHFLKWMLTERNMDRKEAEAVWFKTHEGCYPDGYLGEELMMDIVNKFYYPLDFLSSMLEKRHPELQAQVCKGNPILVNVMPSYEDRTYVLVHQGGRILYEDSWKAWNFQFKSKQEFSEWAKKAYETMEKRLKLYIVVETFQLVVNNVYAFSDWSMTKKKFEEITSVPYEKYLRQVRTKNDCDVLGDSDQTKIFEAEIQ